MISTLASLTPGSRAAVRSVTGSPSGTQRILEMGLTPGTPVEVVRFAPLGDPIEVRVRGYLLSLRKAEARLIEVDAEEP